MLEDVEVSDSRSKFEGKRKNVEGQAGRMVRRKLAIAGRRRGGAGRQP